MTNRRIAEAAEDYCNTIRRLLACITKAQFINVSGQSSDRWPRTLFAVNGPVRLETEEYSQANFKLQFSHGYQMVPSENRRRLQSRVTGYTYSFRHDDEGGQEFLAYHWNPDPGQSVRYPHLHLEAGAGIGMVQLQKAHIPTGFIGIPELVALAIDGLGVKPLKDDWRAILEELSHRRAS